MNNKGKQRNDNSNESTFKKWAIRLGFGAFLIGGAYIAVKEYKRLTNVPPECEDDEVSSTNDRTKKDEDIRPDIDYFSSKDILNELKTQVENESTFGPGDLIVLDYDDEGELNEIHENFSAITYHESNGEKDGRFNLIVKISNSKLERDFDDEEILEKEFRLMMNEVKDSNSNFRSIRYGLRSMAFVGEVNGKSASKLSYSELRKLDVLEGTRYISIDLYRCESEDGVNFLTKLFKRMHPEGSEEGNVKNYMPIIIVMDEGVMSVPENKVVRNFLKIDK